jgi:hypothetical protein
LLFSFLAHVNIFDNRLLSFLTGSIRTLYSGVIKALDASNFHPGGTDSQHNLKSKSSSNLLSADDAAHSSKIFGIRRTHSGASK